MSVTAAGNTPQSVALATTKAMTVFCNLLNFDASLEMLKISMIIFLNPFCNQTQIVKLRPYTVYKIQRTKRYISFWRWLYGVMVDYQQNTRLGHFNINSPNTTIGA